MSSQADIEPAMPEDACGIYGLLTQAFGASYLKFAVYQSPRTVGFLAERIASDLVQEQPSFFVLRRGEELEGFYNAVGREGRFFLNYIATSAAARGSGGGRLLLEHFEATGMARGCTSLGLDVFRSNSAAVDWYRRRGYVTRGSRFRARFALASFSGTDGPSLELDPGALRRALEGEAGRGFSSVDCALSGVAVRLGFIAGTVCNLLEPLGAGALAVAPAAARRFGASRRWLLATGPEAFAGAPFPESQEEALYMTKAFERAGGGKKQ